MIDDKINLLNKFIIFVVLGFIIVSCAPQPTPTVERAPQNIKSYLPLMNADDKLHRRCSEIWRGGGPSKAQWIKDLDLWCVRYNYGTEANGGIWQEYKTNGWTNLDKVFAIDVAAIRAAGAKVIVVVHPNKSDQICKPIPRSKINEFSQFVRQLVLRYDLLYIDLGNEVDANGGIPGLFGCHGNKVLFADTWNLVRSTVPKSTILGMSFMMDTTDKHDYIQYVLDRTSPDFVGVHHYEYYLGEKTTAGGLSAYPGGLSAKIAWAKGRTNADIWVTETNLIWPNGECGDKDFQSSQARYVAALRDYGNIPVVIYSLTNPPGWACAALYPSSQSWKQWNGQSPYP